MVSLLSNTFYVYKAFAILFVTMAHCTYSTELVSRISAVFGTIGVPIFLFASGFFFNRQQNPKVFWIKKIKTIVIPWIVYGIITYIVSCICNNSIIKVLSLFKWIIGNGTWLYFVPILLLCFALFRVCENKWLDIVVFLLFILSNILCVFDIIEHMHWITKYQMLFNWCGFFQLGIFAKKNIKILMENVNKISIKVVMIGVWIIATVCYAATDGVGYWTAFALIYEFLSIISFFIIADTCLKKVNLLIDIGKNTYVIYFLHMQFGMGAVRFVFKRIGILNFEWITLVMQPVCVVLAVYTGIKILQFISRKMHLDKFMWIFGM